MRRVLLSGVATLAIVAGAGLAQAVDVVNEDASAYEIYVSTEGDTKSREVQPGETLTNVCEKCALQIGVDDEIEVEGDVIAVIRDGQFRLSPTTN